MAKVVILFSGGQDSTTVLALALARGDECHTLNFSYGQRHSVEVSNATTLSEAMGASSHRTFELDLSLFQHSALTNHALAVDSAEKPGIVNTYVPARNTIFLSIALGYAETLGATSIMIGASSVDYSGYPDCRPEYFDCMRQLFLLATKTGVDGFAMTLEAPLQYLSKAETVKLGLSLGVDYSKTITCYQADNLGRACGMCPSCLLRKQGFQELGLPDPTLYQES